MTERPTTYPNGTDPAVIRILEAYRDSSVRLALTYQDGTVQRGRISRSAGWGPHPIHVPLIVPTGPYGHCIDANRVVRIAHSNRRNGGVIWERA